MDKTLTQLFNEIESDKGDLDITTTSWYQDPTETQSSFYSQPSINYTQTYEHLFDNIKDSIKNFVEIGICDPRHPGGSLKVWYQYFQKANIYGLDNFWDHQHLIDKYLTQFNNDRTKVFYCDQNKKSDIHKVFSQIEPPNIVIDDGSHWPSSIMVTIATVFPYLKSGGYFIIEDLQTKMFQKYKGYSCAYDNTQITEALLAYENIGYLPRLYISREEHKYILDNTAKITMWNHFGFMIACIQKK